MAEKKGCILIVEDETVVALDISYSIRDLDYEVLGPVTSAESALSLLESKKADLVLMDIHLKGQMNGVEAAGLVRDRFDIPVVFLTAYADESTLLRARAVEPYGYILKPFNKRELSSNIEIALYKHQAEAKIRDSEQRWNSLVANAPTTIVIIGPDEKLQYSNRYPMPLEQLRQVDIFAHILPEYHALVRDAFQRGFRGETFTYEVRAVLPEGNMIWYETQVGPIFEKNKIVAVTHISTDVTARKEADAEREMLLKELEAKNEELDHFAYKVSHDLKAPLTTVRGFLDYLEKDLASGDQTRAGQDMQRIDDAVEKMQNMLSDLLRLSRIGRAINPSKEVPFGDLVKQAVELVHGRLNAGKIQVEIGMELPNVYGDPQRIVEVLQNLLDNSAKYMGSQPEPHITIGLDGYREGMPVFFVRDNGIGIEPQYHDRVFELFGKLDPSVEGTGIGLSLVKRIVEHHGGRIWLESELGSGSTFYFSLPAPEKG